MTRAATIAVVALVLAIAALLFGIFAGQAQAVNGTWARSIARDVQSTRCGNHSWLPGWKCIDSTAPAPSCFGRGGGTWECWGGVTERHDPFYWKWRNCGVYVYVSRYGHTLPRDGTKNCSTSAVSPN